MYVVSFCGKRTAMVSFDWLKHHGIVPTFIPEDHVYFCDGDKVVDKSFIAAHLDLNFFVDDNFQILTGMTHPQTLVLKKKDNYVVGQPERSRWRKIYQDLSPIRGWSLDQDHLFRIL